ncbi:uncharacterized protein LOC122293177 [Carya illinoinensis]|uniref:uncharacterized protein LOC122293177 n=1 Tax=Carya illinoinensis TaxID=32201 RepID=UPI001C72971B|nr:uncharacterized protein LOC122293177 [Carya illinoinensis]
MGKGEEQPSPLTPSTSNSPTADIPSTCPNFTNYMHSYYGPLPMWLPAFPPYLNGYQYPSNIQVNASYPTPLMTTCSATSGNVDIEETPDCRETGMPCTSSKVEESKEDRLDSWETEDSIAGTPQLEDEVGGDMIEEPKSRMEFYSFEELMSYYKQYAKNCWFEVMTRRTERGDDETVRYVTLGCPWWEGPE